MKNHEEGKKPQHVAVIMDGNGRWALEKNQPRVFGHQKGVEAVRKTIEATLRLKIPFLTLYAFSTENWNRPIQEVEALMALLTQMLDLEFENLQKQDIRLCFIGDLSKLPRETQKKITEVVEKTSQNKSLTLILAVNYGARQEIARALEKMQKEMLVLEDKNTDLLVKKIEKYLDTAAFPDPDLLIRTGAEQRVSNFLLWQLAYTELYFTSTYWPDFAQEDFNLAVLEYQKRKRRFGNIDFPQNIPS